VILGLIGAAVTIAVFGWSDDRESELPPTELAQLESARLGLRRPA